MITTSDNFYNTVIPNEIITDSSLSDFEKLLYGDIRVLAKKNGYCYATNQYFQKRYRKSERTVRYAISHLAELNHIIVIINKTKRKIYIFQDYIDNSI